jgi:hypothetical protein
MFGLVSLFKTFSGYSKMNSPNDIEEVQKKTYINHLVDKFYEFMGESYIEYSKLSAIEVTETPVTEVTETPVTETKTSSTIKYKSFIDYFLYKLYYNYGIKRHMVHENIALLYYSKTLKGYKASSEITILCRHMLLDINNLRIISLGIPKSIKIDEFCNLYNIDKNNEKTNFEKQNDDKSSLKYEIYEFIQGTMITYNPSLKVYNFTELPISNPVDDIDNTNNSDLFGNDLQKSELLEQNIEIQFNKQFMYSTRKIVGTGSYNGSKTFLEMFEENNTNNNVKLNDIPEDLLKDKVLVFNIDHPENQVLFNNSSHVNTLCAVFQFKSEELSKSQYQEIINLANLTDEDNAKILTGFKQLALNMVTQIKVDTFNKSLIESGINIKLDLPKLISEIKIDLPDISGMPSAIDAPYVSNIKNINTFSINELEKQLLTKSREYQGYIIYGNNGERTKIINPNFKEIMNLKGNKPINIEPKNTKNLFYLYWRLIKEKNIEKFIAEFDKPNANTECNYKKLFYWFYTLVHNFAMYLFKTYHYTFVKKTLIKQNIPYALKPLCGDLHKTYLENKTPITQTIVEQYLFDQPVTKIFWRLFVENQ